MARPNGGGIVHRHGETNTCKAATAASEFGASRWWWWWWWWWPSSSMGALSSPRALLVLWLMLTVMIEPVKAYQALDGFCFCAFILLCAYLLCEGGHMGWGWWRRMQRWRRSGTARGGCREARTASANEAAAKDDRTWPLVDDLECACEWTVALLAHAQPQYASLLQFYVFVAAVTGACTARRTPWLCRTMSTLATAMRTALAGTMARIWRARRAQPLNMARDGSARAPCHRNNGPA